MQPHRQFYMSVDLLYIVSFPRKLCTVYYYESATKYNSVCNSSKVDMMLVKKETGA